MRKLLVLMCLLLLMTASMVCADSWTSILTNTANSQYIEVVTTATQVGSLWNWTYALTPLNGAKNIRDLTVTLGLDEIAGVSNIITPSMFWYGTINADKVAWGTIPVQGVYDPIPAGVTYTFGFSHVWGPSELHYVSALDTFGFSGVLRGPVPSVPEPMSIMLGIMGLGSVAGFRTLRRN